MKGSVCHLRLVLFIFIVSSLALVPLAVHAQDPPTITIEEIRAAHVRRLANMESVRIQWEEERGVMNGDIIAQVIDDYPTEPYVAYGTGELVVKGSSSRLDYLYDFWSTSDKEVKPGVHPTIFTFHEQIGKTYYRKHNNGNIVPRNPWRNRKQIHMLTMSMLEDPPYLSEPNNVVLGYRSTDEGERVVVGNTDYNDPDINRHGSIRWEFELDPSRDYILTKHISMTPEGNATFMGTLTYEPHPIIGYVPVELNTLRSLVGNLEMANGMDVYRITSAEVNGPVDDGIFVFQFPRGTEVNDEIAGIQYVVGRLENVTVLDEYVADTLAKLTADDSSTQEYTALSQPILDLKSEGEASAGGAGRAIITQMLPWVAGVLLFGAGGAMLVSLRHGKQGN